MNIPSRRASRALFAPRLIAMAALVSGAVLAPAVQADVSLVPSGVAVTVADGNNTGMYGAALNWDSLCACAALKEYGFDTRLVAQLAYWHGREQPAERSSLWDVSLIPMLRWIGPQVGSVRPFAELGVGAHLLSATRINTERIFSTAFQFGDVAGAGITFGERQRYELGVYVHHISNAGIKEPNDGITFFGVVLRTALP
jgi:lipid A 3-O-deacylase